MTVKGIKGNLGGIEIGDESPVRIIGVINLTKNSFYSGSVRATKEEILEEVNKMKKEGADVVDVGARSTAPYRKYEIPVELEKKLALESVRLIASITDMPISIDTTRYEVARTAFEQGATILNNVYGFVQREADRLAKLVAEKDFSLILTAHEKRQKRLSDPVQRVSLSLEAGLKIAADNGIDSAKIAIDPGIGFFKDQRMTNIDWNSGIIANLKMLRKFERPICIGVSRKRFIGDLTGNKPAEMRLSGSLAATAIAIYNGTHVVRTHDVSSTLDAIKVSTAIREKGLIHDAD